jgi:hypothetical protein
MPPALRGAGERRKHRPSPFMAEVGIQLGQ